MNQRKMDPHGARLANHRSNSSPRVDARGECVCIGRGFPAEFSDPCCEADAPAAPDLSSCQHCVVLETGFALSSLQPLMLAVPARRVDEWLTECLALLAKLGAETTPMEECSPPPEQVPLWHFVARTALPVRGPSRA